jgi:RNA polymerase sigma-70 factor (ECF subfamily)
VDDVSNDPVAEALAKDVDAGFADLYGAYQRLVFSVTLRLSGRRADAEDLTAEAFLRAFRALLGYDTDRVRALRTRAWLMTIVMNVWRNHQRTMARKPPPGDIDAAPEPVDGAESVEAAAERHDTAGRLAGLLARLPDPQREAIVLRHVVDLPVGDIASILGMAEGTVRSHISRGLSRLRTDAVTQGGLS